MHALPKNDVTGSEIIENLVQSCDFSEADPGKIMMSNVHFAFRYVIFLTTGEKLHVTQRCFEQNVFESRDSREKSGSKMQPK